MSNYGESATIKTPEVGDIFFNKKSRRKIIILYIKKHCQCLVENGCLIMRYKSEFDKMVYLGKSKTNISDLFEVKDD